MPRSLYDLGILLCAAPVGGEMDELVIPKRRGPGIVGAVVSAVFLAFGLVCLVAGTYLLADGRRGEDFTDASEAIGVGGLIAVGAATGLFFSIRSTLSRGLRLSAEGFALQGRMTKWTDVTDFYVLPGSGEGVGDILKVRYVHSTKPRRAVKDLVVANFDTGGPPLDEIMRRWSRGDRSSWPLERSSAAVAPQFRRPETELVITQKRDTGALIGATALLLIAAIAGPALYLYARFVDHEQPDLLAVIVGGSLWLLCAGFCGLVVHLLRREQPALILHANGFSYDKVAWAWADIQDIQPFVLPGHSPDHNSKLQVIWRRDRPLSSSPTQLPFSRSGFATEHRLIDAVLRERLQRSRTQNKAN